MGEKKKCSRPYTSKDKWVVSIISGLLFLLIASPFMFTVTNKLTGLIGLNLANSQGCPLLSGLLVHAIVFILIVRIMMK